MAFESTLPYNRTLWVRPKPKPAAVCEGLDGRNKTLLFCGHIWYGGPLPKDEYISLIGKAIALVETTEKLLSALLSVQTWRLVDQNKTVIISSAEGRFRTHAYSRKNKNRMASCDATLMIATRKYL